MRYPDERTPLDVTASATSLSAIIKPIVVSEGKTMRDHSYVNICERRHLAQVCANNECQLRRVESDEYLGRSSPATLLALDTPCTNMKKACHPISSGHQLRRSSSAAVSELSDPDTDSASETEVERHRPQFIEEFDIMKPSIPIVNATIVPATLIPATLIPITPTIVPITIIPVTIAPTPFPPTTTTTTDIECTRHPIQPDFILTPPVTPCGKCTSPIPEVLAKREIYAVNIAEANAVNIAANNALNIIAANAANLAASNAAIIVSKPFIESYNDSYSNAPTPAQSPSCDIIEPVATSFAKEDFCSTIAPVVVQIECEPAPDGVEQFIVTDPFASPIVTKRPPKKDKPAEKKPELLSPSKFCISNVTSIGTFYNDYNNFRVVKRRYTKGQCLKMSSKDTIHVKIVNGCIIHVSDEENASERAPNMYRALTRDDNDPCSSDNSSSSASGSDNLQGSARTGNLYVTNGVINSTYPLCDHNYYNNNAAYSSDDSYSPSKEPERRSSEILRAALLNNSVQRPIYGALMKNRPPPPPYKADPKDVQSAAAAADFVSESDRTEFDAKLRFAADERRGKKLRRKQSQIRKLRLATSADVPYAGASCPTPMSLGEEPTNHPPLTSRQRAIQERNGSYVKITGSYQDDYVYYATKRSRGRPRKPSNDSSSGFVPKEPYPVGQMVSSVQPALPQGATIKNPVNNEFFEWYLDLAKTKDKDSHFSTAPSTPHAVPTPDIEVTKESEVAELVMDMELDRRLTSDTSAPPIDTSSPSAGTSTADMTPEAFLSLLNDMGPNGIQELERTLSVGYDEPPVDAGDGNESQQSSSTITATALPPVHSSSPPQLTTVTMYWNDLPGLIINSIQCVRLVDIHKQILPAKDTGILKKRCLMLTMQVRLCTELERDFLIRYANAAKSKSLLIIEKAQAQRLIAFYVNPRPRVHRSTSDCTSSEEQPAEDIPNRPKDKSIAPRRAVNPAQYRNRKKPPVVRDRTPSSSTPLQIMPPAKRRRKLETSIGHRDLAMPRRSNLEKGHYAAMLHGEKPCVRRETEDEDVNVVDTSDTDSGDNTTTPTPTPTPTLATTTLLQNTIRVTRCTCRYANSEVYCNHYAILHVNYYTTDSSPCISCNQCQTNALMSLIQYMSHRHDNVNMISGGASLRHLISRHTPQLSMNLWNKFKQKSTYLSSLASKNTTTIPPTTTTTIITQNARLPRTSISLPTTSTTTSTTTASTSTTSITSITSKPPSGLSKIQNLEPRMSKRVRKRKQLHPIER